MKKKTFNFITNWSNKILKIKIINIGFLQFNISNEIMILKSLYVNFKCPCEMYVCNNFLTLYNLLILMIL